jgi:hypothetical protein
LHQQPIIISNVRLLINEEIVELICHNGEYCDNMLLSIASNLDRISE